MTISEAVLAKLESLTDLTDIVGTKIYPEAAKQETEPPFLVYHLEIRQAEDVLAGPTPMLEATLQFSALSDQYDEAHEIAEVLRLGLSFFKGVMGGVGGLQVEAFSFEGTTGSYESEIGLFNAAVSFLIHYLPS